uniref:RNA-directed RNA polymerase n=1 Tax=Rhodochaete parvula toti-like virus 1 TaxID=2933126 RepID=A0A9C7GXC0_9VIRU|nr:RNA-dependent RNA polymerase [Rhodochaete parvula toti-like virus 1]CAI5383981.1 RNA-dependent RNA polymerase [Rhodochaete parvula toti-like virus 1]
MLDKELRPTCKVSETTYVLVETEKKQKKKKYQTNHTNSAESEFIQTDTNRRRVHGTIIMTTEIIINDTVAIYVNVSDVSSYMPRMYKIVGAVLIGNYRHGFVHGLEDNWYEYMSTIKQDDISYVYDITKLTREKITQWHHIHVRAKDVFSEKTLMTGREALIAKLLCEFSMNEVTHMTFWTYYSAADEKTRSIFCGMLKHYGKIDTEWLKKEGTAAKQMQSVLPLDLSSLFELNVLVNRIESSVDWDKEKKNRIEPKLTNIPFDDVYKKCYELFCDAKREGKRAYRYSYREYWQQRVVLMPGGSVHSEDFGDKKIAKKLPQKLKNKKGLFSSMLDMKHDDWLSREEKIDSYASTKYEWGKVRALYGCDLTSHVHADFALNKCEETFPSYIPTGSRANDKYVQSVAQNLKHMIPFCYDYDDFNSQHSFSSMKAALCAWKHVFYYDLTDEQRKSLDWTINSIGLQQVHNGYNGDTYRTNGTLFSGWRLTTFMNTALNYAYLADSGVRKYTAYSLHNGDDVYAATRSIGDIVALIKETEKRDIRAQPVKMNIGTIAEFLRMDFNAKVPTAKQYLTRGCATFVHSRIESESPLVQRSVYRAIRTRGEEVIARGGNTKFIKEQMDKQYKHAAEIFGTEEMSEKLNKLDLVAGGWESTHQAYRYEIIDSVVEEDDDIDMSMITPGIKDFVTYVCEKLPNMRSKANVKQMEKSLRNSFNAKRTKLEIVGSSKQEQYKLMSLRGAWKSITKLGTFAKARMTSADLVAALANASPSHAAVLQRSTDPYKLAGIML